MDHHSTPLTLVLPTGTRIVTRVEAGTGTRHPAGSVGDIVEPPLDGTHAYRVRFADGSEATLRRSELSLLKDHQRPSAAPENPAADDVLPDQASEYGLLIEHVIFRCVSGSRAYGLDDEASDTDRRGIYLPPADLHWSLHGVPEQLESSSEQSCYWELEKFLVLALKGNPNILECLWSPSIEHADPIAEELLANRGKFLSRLVFQTFNGYAMSQFRKLETDLRTRGAPRWKHVMHLVRLLLSGIVALEEARIPVRVDDLHRPRLLAIKAGQESFQEVDRWRLTLHAQFETAYRRTRLPERPDYRYADDLLRRARRSRL